MPLAVQHRRTQPAPPRVAPPLRPGACRRHLAAGLAWRPQAGQPKVPPAVASVPERGLVEIGPDSIGFRARFTAASPPCACSPKIAAPSIPSSAAISSRTSGCSPPAPAIPLTQRLRHGSAIRRRRSPPRASAVPSMDKGDSRSRSQRDRHVRLIAERGRMGEAPIGFVRAAHRVAAEGGRGRLATARGTRLKRQWRGTNI